MENEDKHIKIERQRFLLDVVKSIIIFILVVVAFLKLDIEKLNISKTRQEHDKAMAERQYEHEKIKTYLNIASSKNLYSRLSSIELIIAVNEDIKILKWAENEKNNIIKKIEEEDNLKKEQIKTIKNNENQIEKIEKLTSEIKENKIQDKQDKAKMKALENEILRLQAEIRQSRAQIKTIDQNLYFNPSGGSSTSSTSSSGGSSGGGGNDNSD